MVIEYNSKYDEEVKMLLKELQVHITSIDREKYNIITKEFKEEYFKKTLDEIKKYNGKMLLYKEEEKIIGIVVGLVNNDKIDTYDFKAPKRGRISELVVCKEVRNKGYGKVLLKAMEEYLLSIGCKDILIGVFAYNDSAKKFYEKNGYHTRMIEMTKSINK